MRLRPTNCSTHQSPLACASSPTYVTRHIRETFSNFRSLQRLEVGDAKAKVRATGEKKSKITKKSGGKKGKKDGPKRPLSAFMYFSQDQRAAVKAANPDATFGELGKLLAEKWGSTSDRKVRSRLHFDLFFRLSLGLSVN